MSRLTLKIADKTLCNYNTFFVKSLYGKEFYICIEKTKNHNLKLTDVKGKSFDKCTMSNWFYTYDYYAIYWDKANKQTMIETIINELRNM